MKLSCVASLVGGALLLLSPLLPAQGLVVKKKVVSQDQYQKMVEPAVTRSALGGETLNNGDYVSLHRKGEEGRVNGVFVYEDTKNQKLYVRTRPGTAPVAVPVKEIDEIDRVVPASTQKDKGGVRFATDDLTGAAPREIVVQYIYNGGAKEIRYYGPTLSAAEKQELAALEKAANELALDEETVRNLERAVNEPPASEQAARPAQSTGPGFAWDFYSNNNSPFGFSPFGFGSPFLFPMMMGASAPNINITMPSPPAPPPNPAEQQKSLQDARARVERDRQAYQTARSRAIFDSEGSIIAVRLDEK